MMTRVRLVTVRAIWLGLKISTTTAIGGRLRNTATCGFHACLLAGPRIGRDIGPGLILGDGPGSMTIRGGMRHFTLDAGPRSMVVGSGSPGRVTRSRYAHPLGWRLRWGEQVR